MAVSTRKPKLSLKYSSTSAQLGTDGKPPSTSNTIASQGTTLSQLTEQVSEIKQSHKMIFDCFDQLAAQMVTLIANSATSPKKCPARGHNSESGMQHDELVQYKVR